MALLVSSDRRCTPPSQVSRNNGRYDSCDVGTFPNQTYANHSGPAAALHSDMSRARYNHELSWLPGQKLSYVC